MVDGVDFGLGISQNLTAIGYKHCDKQMADLQLKSERESLHSQNSHRVDTEFQNSLFGYQFSGFKPGSTAIPNIEAISPGSAESQSEEEHK